MKKRPLLIQDPVARVLLDWLRLTPMKGGVLAFLISVLYAFGLSATFGILNADSGFRAVLDDFPNLGVLLLISPAVWVYYLWQIGSISGALSLIERSAKNPGQMTEELELEKHRYARLTWPVVLSALTASILSVHNIQLSQAQFGESWITYNWQMSAALQIIRWPVFYMVVMILIRQALASTAMNRVISRQPLKVILRHPDGRGGMSGLGHYAIASASMIPIAGLYLGLVWAREGLLALAPGGLYFPAVLIYLVVSPLVLFWPIIRVHDQMKAAKSRLLGEIATLFEEEYAGLIDQLHQDILAPDVAIRLRAFRKIYQTAENAPEWPINLALLSQFIVAVLLPVIIPIILRLLAGLMSQ